MAHLRDKFYVVYYVYILLSLKDGKLYIGLTSYHPTKRLKEHNKGNTKSTKSRLPFKLLYYEAHTSEKDARRRERYFKTDKGKSSLKQMLREALSARN
ncbi:MAG: GIY-YIG nuclease family protein [Patescibacteria group bacterium]